MSIFFITGSEGKYQEIKAIIPEVERLDINLLEIQEVEPEVIIRTKLQEAFKHKHGEFIVEDTSLYLDCLNGLPGPLIKWFMKTIGNEGLFNLADKLGNNEAVAETIIGYATDKDDLHFFEGSIKGTIVRPRGKEGFGWDSIFQPEGYQKTFAEMTQGEKNQISMRKLAATKLKDYLKGQSN